MVTTLKQLKPIINDDVSQITIGKSKFSDDVWDLSLFMPSKTLKKSEKKVNFSYIESEKIKLTVKKYAYYKLGKVKPITVRAKINSTLPKFIYYCEEKNINSFSQINKKIFFDYIEKLNKSKISVNFGYYCSQVVEEIIKVGQIKGWDVPIVNFNNISSYEIWEPKKKNNTKKVKPIPKDIFNKILYCAINEDENILTRSAIIIQSQTGLRISEVLSIKKGCIITTEDDYDYMILTSTKTEKESIAHKVLVNDLVKDTVKELEEYSRDLRKKSGLNELFLYNSGVIRPIKGSTFTKERIRTFIERNDIRDKKGKLYPLHSHQFRATFVRELIKKKVPISFIRKHFNHVSIEMTSYYLFLEQEEIKEIYGKAILDPNSKLAGKRAKNIGSILEQEFQGKTEEEIDEIIDNLTKSMSFNPLPAGVCLYDLRRGNCNDGDGCFIYNCPNYITEIRFYPVLKKELDLLDKEMVRFEKLGRERDYQRIKIKHKHLKPLVDDLENQMELTDLHELKIQLNKKAFKRLEVKLSE